jgi:hypothetical protein
MPSELIDISITNNTDDYNKNIFDTGIINNIKNIKIKDNFINILTNKYIIKELYRILFANIKNAFTDVKAEKRIKRMIVSTMIEYLKNNKTIITLQNEITRIHTVSKITTEPFILNKGSVYILDNITNEDNKLLISLLYREIHINKNGDKINKIIRDIFKNTSNLLYKQKDELNYGGYYSKYLKYKNKYLQLKK